MTKNEWIAKYFPKKHTNPDSFTSSYIYGVLAHCTLYEVEINMCDYPKQLKELSMQKYIGALEMIKNQIAAALDEMDKEQIDPFIIKP